MARGNTHAKARAMRDNRTLPNPAFRLKPPTKRGALLSGTALAAGVLATAMVGLPRPALAVPPGTDACGTPAGPPYAVACVSNMTYPDGVDYYDSVFNHGDFEFVLNHNTFNDTLGNGGENAAAFNIYMQNGGNFDLLRVQDSGGNNINATGVHGMWVDTDTGNITFHDVFLTISAVDGGSGTLDATYTGGTIAGALLLSHGGNITLQKSSIVEVNSEGDGIVADTTKQYDGSVPTAGDISINTTYAGSEGDEGGSIIAARTGIFAKTDGDVTINNELGHIEGGTGAGVEIAGYGNGGATVDNHSYLSMIGYDGLNIHDKGSASVYNGNGLIAGLGADGDGVRINNIDNPDSLAYAAYVDNTSAGVIAGNNNGLNITNVGGDGIPDIFVNNRDYGSAGIIDPGGLIVGVNGDGVHIDTTTDKGDVFINNGGTRNNGFNLTQLDSQVYDGLGTSGLLYDPFGVDTGASSQFAAQPAGIWGWDDGIEARNVDGQVVIDNSGFFYSNADKTDQLYEQGGLIVGITGDGVHLSHIGGNYNYDNRLTGATVLNEDGLIWGGGTESLQTGIHMYDVHGDVLVDNVNGTTFGGDEGIHIAKVTGGNVTINNAGGFIQGFYGDAIHIWNVMQAYNDVSESDQGGVVRIANGDFTSFSPTYGELGGRIYSADTAIYVNSPVAWIGNGDGGDIIGDGSWHQPVVRLKLDNDNHPSEWMNEFSGIIDNNGLMASSNVPYFQRLGGWSLPDPTVVPSSGDEKGYTLDRDAIYADALAGISYVMSGGTSGTVADTHIADYENAANDVLLKTDGGATLLYNWEGGAMFGRVNMDGHDSTEGGWLGNTIVNRGFWGTVDRYSYGNYDYGNEMHGSSHDQIYNLGWLQTAFDPEGKDHATFDGVNQFYNGGIYNKLDTPVDGWLSMVDGSVGDKTSITHDFYGSYDNSLYHSYLAVDVRFGPNWDPDVYWADQVDTFGKSDRLYVEGTVYGTTALQIIKQNTSPGSEVLGDQIKVAEFGL